jgi:hypothetical protein
MLPLTPEIRPVTMDEMNAIPQPLIPADALADLEHALRLQETGRRDPAFENRIGEQTEKIRQQIRATHGILNIAVDLIREGREEE